jgi:hypothetical protein
MEYVHHVAAAAGAAHPSAGSARAAEGARSAQLPQRPRPELTVANCVSILISSDFLKMGALVAECEAFLAAHLSEVAQLPIDLSCISDATIERCVRARTGGSGVAGGRARSRREGAEGGTFETPGRCAWRACASTIQRSLPPVPVPVAWALAPCLPVPTLVHAPCLNLHPPLPLPPLPLSPRALLPPVRISAQFTPSMLRRLVDRKGKMSHRLYAAALSHLIAGPASGLRKCADCSRLFTREQGEWEPCARAQPTVDSRGCLSARHTAATDWDRREWVSCAMHRLSQSVAARACGPRAPSAFAHARTLVGVRAQMREGG